MLRSWKVALFGITLAIAPLVACTSAPAQTARVYIREGPPPLRHEVIVARPGPEYIYVRGHWIYGRNGGYAWAPGRWLRPEGARRRWEEGQWVHERRGWYYTEGRWR
jgi:hypothetical protein